MDDMSKKIDEFKAERRVSDRRVSSVPNSGTSQEKRSDLTIEKVIANSAELETLRRKLGVPVDETLTHFLSRHNLQPK